MPTQKHSATYELLMNTPLRHDCSWSALALVLVLCNFFVVLPRFDAIDDMIFEYYHSLPVAVNMDVDRDGIVDQIDDSDGDSIADTMDATPFGVVGTAEESKVYLHNTIKYAGIRMHSATR